MHSFTELSELRDVYKKLSNLFAQFDFFFIHNFIAAI